MKAGMYKPVCTYNCLYNLRMGLCDPMCNPLWTGETSTTLVIDFNYNNFLLKGIKVNGRKWVVESVKQVKTC